MKKLKGLFAFILLLNFMMVSITASNNYTNAQLPVQVDEENNPTLTLKHRIYIENFIQGVVSVVNNNGNHVVVGNVYRPATVAKNSSDGFWAAHYDKASDGTFSCVTAIGTNAMHLKVGPTASYNPIQATAWTPKQISVGINEDHVHAGGTYSDSMIYTSIAGGTNIFGGSSAPYVGNPVKYLTANGVWESLDTYFNNDFTKPIPKRLLIEVYEASTSNGTPDYIEFENWAKNDSVGGVAQSENGRVLVHYPNGTQKHVADIIQRVQGTGRFGGSEYAEAGRLRAAHPGVICLSTSPKVGYTTNSNLRGGFQFVPANHAKYLSYDLAQDSFIGRDQWGIVSYVGATKDGLYDMNYIVNGEVSYNPIWEGVAPLFTEYINPRHIPGSPMDSTYFMVSTDFGVTWNEPVEILGVTDATNSPVATWTNIRLYLN
jgi:hypothetical protein